MAHTPNLQEALLPANLGSNNVQCPSGYGYTGGNGNGSQGALRNGDCRIGVQADLGE